MPIQIRRVITVGFLGVALVGLSSCANFSKKSTAQVEKKQERRMAKLRKQLVQTRYQNQILKEENVVLRELAKIDEAALKAHKRKSYRRTKAKYKSISAKTASQYAGEDLLYIKVTEAYKEKDLQRLLKRAAVLKRRFPRSRFLDRAMFLHGDLLQQRGLHAKALEVFDRLLKQYPRTSRMPAVLLGKGRSYEKLNVQGTAVGFYKKVLKRFPGSKESLQAKSYLSRLSL